jgi:uncharacterized protein YyaL (SSP411 family)
MMRLLPYVLTVALLLPSGVAHAYRHHTSKIRYEEHSRAVFDQARREGKPVFLLISAVWCYWCKYFDEHALETDEVSGYLNRHYLSIFVDSDLRMDLTRKYVRGWPMTVLFDPEGRVRLSFPGALRKEDFLAILKRVEEEVRSGLARAQPAEPEPAQATAPLPVTLGTYRQLLDEMGRYLDEEVDSFHGGFGTGRKFPHGRLLAYLLELDDITRDSRRLAALEKTLEGILGGLFDPVDGGFFRYAERREWREPHTEKMLYVNASLALVFHRASWILRNPRYAHISDATIAFMLRTLYDVEAGGFHGSQTADPGYYRLPPGERGAARRPAVNRDKVTAWNAEAVLTFLTIGQATGRQDLKDAAFRSLEFMRRHLLTDKGIYHIYQHTTRRGHLRGQLEANAWAALAFLEGHRVSGRAVYRQAAEQLLGYALAELFDRQRGGFVAGNNPDDSGPGARSNELSLEANGVMAEALLRAHRITRRGAYLDAARQVLATLGGEVKAILVGDREVSAGAVTETVFPLRAYGQLLTQTPNTRRGAVK